MEAALMDLISVLGVLGGSMLLGATKKYTAVLDGKIGNFVKPVQPLVVLAAGVGLPYLTQAIGIADVDPQLFITAPTATLLTVSAREGSRRLRGLKRSQGAS